MVTEHLGRGGEGRVRFFHDRVKKVSREWEPKYLASHHDVFVRVKSVQSYNGTDLVEFTMPRLRAPSIPNEGAEALASGYEKLQRLWRHRYFVDPFQFAGWRDRLFRHLSTRMSAVPDFPDTLILDVIARLPEPEPPIAIHGDATLANLLFDKIQNTWVWCDPLDREFIPQDRRVDMGKILQSCYGYERVLLGQRDSLALNTTWIPFLMDSWDYEIAHIWCIIHFMRAIPYQDDRVKEIIVKWLRELA